MADGIQFNVDAALAKLGEMVAKHGPEAVNAAAQVVQMNAVNTLVSGVGYAVMAGVAFKFGQFFHKKLQVQNDRYDAIEGKIGWGLCFAANGIFGMVMAYATLASVTDVWAWTALFNPKLALAHAVLAKFAGL